MSFIYFEHGMSILLSGNESLDETAYLRLTDKQLEYLIIYRRSWQAKASRHMAIFDLSQNPAKRPNQTTRLGKLPTLRCNSLFWVDSKSRRLRPSELARAMGKLPVEGLNAKQLGNGMHVACCGAALSLACMCVHVRR